MNHRPTDQKRLRVKPVDPSRGLVQTTVFGVRIATLLLVIFWFAMFTGTHMPRVGVPNVNHADKLLHFGGFTCLAFLMAWAIPTQYGRPRWNVLLAAAACVGYAAIDEFTQIPVGRTADVLDWLADTAGVIVGLTAYLVMRTCLQRNRSFGRVALTMPQSHCSH